MPGFGLLLPAGANLACCSITEQTIKLQLGNAVAPARADLKAAAIEDRDIATLIADEAGPLKEDPSNSPNVRYRAPLIWIKEFLSVIVVNCECQRQGCRQRSVG